MKTLTRNFGLILAALCLTAGLVLAGENKHVGTWTVDLDDSKYSPGPAPKSMKLVIEPAGPDGVKLSSKGEAADGTPTHIEYTAQFDGKDYPIAGYPGADTVSLKRIDDKTIEAHLKSGGKTVMTVRTTLSDDGKSRTSWFNGTNQQGQQVNNTVVYRRIDSAQKAED